MNVDSFLMHRACLGANKKKHVPRHLPAPTGHYSVGSLDFMCDPLSEEGSFFRLYYPIHKTDIYKRCKQWPLWLPRRQYCEGYAHFLGINDAVFGKIFKWMGGDIHLPVLWQSPPCHGPANLPIMIFSHGIGGNRTSNSVFCIEMASQGYIVAAVEHRDGSASMTYNLTEVPGENVKIVEKETSEENNHFHSNNHRTRHVHSYTEEWKPFERFDPWDDYEYRNRQVHHRCKEAIRALEILLKLNNGVEVHNTYGGNFNNKLFKGRMDVDRIVICGHSFGGSTTLTALAEDKRFKLGIVQDGWMHPLDSDIAGRVTQPMLMVNMETFQWKKNIQQMLDVMAASSPSSSSSSSPTSSSSSSPQEKNVMITIKGSCHKSVTDFQFTVNKALGRLLTLRHTASPKVVMDINNKACLGFLSKHLGFGQHHHDDILSGQHRRVISGTNVKMS